jgi:hypothetical protein
MEELVEMITCRQCGQQKIASRYTPGWCEDCEKAYNNRYSYLRSLNEGWQDISKDAGLEIWERQPQETQLEWSIWQAYRDSYPGAKPSYKAVAEQLGTTYDFVKKVARRWDFQIRMQAWISECDRITIAQRRQEVLDMNKSHIDMAKKLRDKLEQAIDLVDPAALKPSELNSLLKTVTDLEKKAALDTVDQEVKLRDAAGSLMTEQENPDIKSSPTKKDDLGAVINILMQAGALGDITHVGVRKTETTEMIVATGDGSE